MKIIELSERHYFSVVKLANQVHGANYLNEDTLDQFVQQGLKNGVNASFIAIDTNKQVVGYRLSLAAGNWQPDGWCTEPRWPVARDKMAYFKSVAVSPESRGQGIASRLLASSLQALKMQGATAGLAHIWRESPGGAAEKYFTAAGATIVNIHPDRWLHLSASGYLCPVCGKICHCTAAEMVLLFSADNHKG